MADIDVQPPHIHPQSEAGDSNVDQGQDQEQVDKKLAERLSVIIEEANERVTPVAKLVRQVRCDLSQSSRTPMNSHVTTED